MTTSWWEFYSFTWPLFLFETFSDGENSADFAYRETEMKPLRAFLEKPADNLKDWCAPLASVFVFQYLSIVLPTIH